MNLTFNIAVTDGSDDTGDDFLEHPSVSSIARRQSIENFTFQPISTGYIRGILDHLNPRKAVGVDGITPGLLRLSAPVLAKEITKLINFTISTSSWPSEWKSSNVTPVFKKDDDTQKSNYRPISILPAISKICEKVLYDQIYDAIQPHLSLNLSGFLKTHSCCTALLKMTEDWRESLDDREAVIAVAVDLSKAFDSINHRLLLAKLRAYGFSQPALDLMTSYLLERKQRVRVKGVVSSYSTVKTGVPQGSLLGPLLFNIFINDVNYSVPNVSLRLYADDTTSYGADVSPTVLEFVVNKDLKTLSSWFKSNHLNVNNSKTQAFSVGPCKYDYGLYLDSTKIDTTNNVKILGVTLDSKLNFKIHISEQLKKAYAKAAALRRIRKSLPIDKMIMLYKAFILPHLEYCGPLMLGLGKVQSDRLDNANYYILRSVLGYGKTVPYEQILSTVELSNLKKRRIYQSMVLVYKSLYGDGPEYIKNLFSFRKTHYSLRGDGYKLAIPRFNLLWKKKSFSYMAANVWNSLPSKVHNTASLTEFKSNLKKAIL